MRQVIAAFALALALSPAIAAADGCYMCGAGSAPACKNYCRYSGADTFANRKKCQARGCKVSGATSCPKAANYKVCLAPTADAPVVASR